MPIKKQYGVIPYFHKSDKLKIILITSRKSRQWIVPKGDLFPHKSKSDAALREAFEEAGVLGQIDKSIELKLSITSGGEQIQLILYPMKVKTKLDNWPEKKQRKRIVVSSKNAKALVKWTDFKSCIKRIQKSL
jgi:8-oxo-dGTP pyrophosphatase MutT (NUDIX family)